MQEFNVQDNIRLYKRILRMKKLREEYETHFGPFGEEILYELEMQNNTAIEDVKHNYSLDCV